MYIRNRNSSDFKTLSPPSSSTSITMAPSPTALQALEASPRVHGLLARLHAESEAQEKTLSQSWFYFKYLFGFYFTGKTWSTSADAHMSDKFVALEQDKCLFMYLIARSINAKNIVEAGTSFGNVNAMRARDDKVAGRVIATEWESSKAERARKHWSEAGEEVEPGMPEEIDMMLLDTWIPMALPALEIIKPRLKRGAIILADNTKMAKALYKEFLDYIHDPKNGFKTTTTAYSGGLEMIVYLP
ncbi:hypothetical protein QL093DRAFT_2635105 [Fusarium oxysporum]|nr:hypothetical protein QL093DRAFT_2635105 [Fusarium oxysporum]